MGEMFAAGLEFLGSFGSEAAAPLAAEGLETGLGSIGVGLGELGSGAGGALGAGGAIGSGFGSFADIIGSGAGMFGGETGLAGTTLAGGAGGDIAGLLGAGAGGGLGALGAAESFMAAPAASGFGSGAALTGGIGSGALGSGAGASGANAALAPFQPTAMGGVTSSSLPSSVSNANAGASVFETGTSPVTASPGTTSASSLAAPPGVTSPLGVDPTAAASGATNAAGTAAKSTSIESLLGKAGNGLMDSITKNPLGIALGAGGLGYNILSGQKQSGNQKALAADAQHATANSDRMVASGEALQQYLTNGTLPPAYQQQVDQAIQDAKTTAISNAASQGQPTDPKLNTALAATLAKIDSSRAGMQAQVAGQLFSSGSSLVNAGQQAAGLSGSLYQALVQNDTTQAANTGKAIATLAAALNGKSSANVGGINISTG